MKRHTFAGGLVIGTVMVAAIFFAATSVDGQQTHVVKPLSNRSAAKRAEMDRDLLEVTIPVLEAFYSARKYSAVEVTLWYLDRIARYDGVYRAVLHVDAAGALATAAAEDAAAKKAGKAFKRSTLWGVPIVIKANTSVNGLVTSAGWYGYVIPGHELIAPADATIIAKMRAAGAIILGQTNMPDFAASDTNFSTVFGRTGNAYDVRFSPGGSSGGTVTAVTANFAVFGNGTDTGNSIRMPAGTSAVVGLFPTRGLVSIAGIHPLDWLRDNTGPIARDVTDVAIALDVMSGEDAMDPRTNEATKEAQPGPYTKYLKTDALKGKRFGVPAFIVRQAPAGSPQNGSPSLQPETREMFMKAIEGLRQAGATVVFDDEILPDSFAKLCDAVNTQPYVAEGTQNFLREFGPAEYKSFAEFAKAVGTPLPGFMRGVGGGPPSKDPAAGPRLLESDPQAETTYFEPRRKARAAYDDALDRFHLDGFVYPALQMPSNDETIPLMEGRRSDGPHSNTAWVDPIGVPAIVVPGGFYPNALPFGLEIATRRWKDGDLLGWAFAYEQATKHRRPPVLVDKH
ncbi:hypothetical protein BH10ACI2_BH10ACI2_10730 [soil metagenome]